MLVPSPSFPIDSSEGQKPFLFWALLRSWSLAYMPDTQWTHRNFLLNVWRNKWWSLPLLTIIQFMLNSIFLERIQIEIKLHTHFLNNYNHVNIHFVFYLFRAPLCKERIHLCERLGKKISLSLPVSLSAHDVISDQHDKNQAPVLCQNRARILITAVC